MNLFRILILSALALYSSTASSQEIYDSPDTVASYGNVRETLNFMFKLSTVISNLNCTTEDDSLVPKLTAVLVIDEKGVVKSAEIPNLNVDSVCLSALKKEFLNMKKWTPARVKGKPVVSKYNFVVSCFLWDYS